MHDKKSVLLSRVDHLTYLQDAAEKHSETIGRCDDGRRNVKHLKHLLNNAKRRYRDDIDVLFTKLYNDVSDTSSAHSAESNSEVQTDLKR